MANKDKKAKETKKPKKDDKKGGLPPWLKGTKADKSCK